MKTISSLLKLWLSCDWLIELSDNNLASETVENRSFLNQSQSRKLLFFMINGVTPVKLARFCSFDNSGVNGTSN